jgi:hypothetical protein
MDTRRGRYCDLAVFHNRMIYPVVYASGEEVNEFKTEGMDLSAKKGRKITNPSWTEVFDSLWGRFFIRW